MRCARVFAILLLTVTTACTQSDQRRVGAVLKQLEHAEQAGNFNAWAGVWTRDKSVEIEKLRPYMRPRPEAQYRAMKVFIRGDQAVLFVQRPFASPSFVTMMLRREGGQWKIQDQMWRDTAPDGNSVYALLPPGPGAFARAGSPWDQVAPGVDPNQPARRGWQMKAVFDESYLYIRIQSSTELPAPGSTIRTPPGGWPVLHIDTSDAGQFVLWDAVNVGDQATFDEHGKANSHRPFAAYMIRLERNDHEVFSTSAGLDPSPLLRVAGRDYDIRIPLATMGITDSRATRMTIGDAQRAMVSIAVQRFPR